MVSKQALADVCDSVISEMSERLEREYSEKDRLAISTAVCKAAFQGVHLGMRETTAQFIEQLPGIQITGLDSVNVEPPDSWAERYGPDAA